MGKPDEPVKTIVKVDDSKSTDAVTPAPPTTSSPAIHTSEFWGGPRALVSLPDDVGVIETKQQYFEEINKRGLRMKDQQESTTGPEQDVDPWRPNVALPEPRRTPPLTKAQAEGLCAGAGVMLERDLKHAEYCPTCFSRDLSRVARVTITRRWCRVECTCGAQEYRAPMGTTDLYNSLSNTTSTLNDESSGVVVMTHGQVTRPAEILQKDEALALFAYQRVMQQLGIEAHWFCDRCWDHVHTSEDHEIAVKMDERDGGEIVMICPCRMLYYRGFSL